MLIETYKYTSEEIPITVNITSKKGEFVNLYEMTVASISKNTELILEKIRQELSQEVELGAADITDQKKGTIIKKRFEDTIKRLVMKYFPGVDPNTLTFLTSYLIQHSLGLGNLEILLDDKNLEEIAVNGADQPVWVYHHKHGWLKTNITLKNEDQVKHYANLIGRKVGRSITLLSPLLDAQLETGERANATLQPISTIGNTITIRKFKAKPYTITDFLQEGTATPQAAALFWLAVQYELSILVSGGTASGKTSELNAITGFIPPNQRVISIEDSVTGDNEILIKRNDKIEKIEISKLIDSMIEEKGYKTIDYHEVANNNNIELLSMNKDGKIKLTKPSSFIRHKVSKPIIEISLASGRKIKVTKDHSLFTLINNKIKPLKCSDIIEGSTFIATPRMLPIKGNEKSFDLTLYLDKFKDFMIKGVPIKKIIESNNPNLRKIVKKGTLRHYKKNSILPIKLLCELLDKYNIKLSNNDKYNLRILPKRSGRYGRHSIPLIINVDNNLACLMGLWLADGSYDKNSIIFSVVDKKEREIVKEFADKFNTDVKMHSDKVSLMLNSSALKKLFRDVLELNGNAYTKEIPTWVFNLKRDELAYLLKGYFSGDGCVKNNEITITSSSMRLLESIQSLLLYFGIPLRISRKIKKDITYDARISGSKFCSIFKTKVGFLQDYKNLKLQELTKRKYHDVTDIIPLEKTSYLDLKHLLGDRFKERLSYKSWKSWQGSYNQGSNIGRFNLQSILALGSLLILHSNNKKILDINKLAFNDIFWDKVIKIKEINYNGYVYDIAVPENESFICNNIIAHNTRELTLPSFMHWIPMLTRLPNVEGKGEVTMLDLLVNSLRMRPDRIIVGEIRRQNEAEVLFEAIHTGHSVYATVHADNVDETITRLINPPINISKTLLPAISMITTMWRNRRTGIRRLLQVAEINKDSSTNILLQRDIRTDKLNWIKNSKTLFPTLMEQTGLNMQEVKQSLSEKVSILKWMAKNNINTVDGVGKVMANYYTNKNELMAYIAKSG